MGDYIERQAAVYAVRDHFCDSERTLETIIALPAANVRPVVRGRWSWRTGSEYRCTNCGRHTHVDEVMEEPAYNYCPYCGADMRGGSEQ